MVVKSKIKAFTLVELLITLAITAILAAIATPSFKEIIQNNRMTTQYNKLLSGLSLARSEAIKRETRVTICQSSTGNSCGADSSSWHSGWVVFVDDDDDNAIDGGEEIIRIHGQLTGGNTLTFGNRTRVPYKSDGLAVGGSNGTFTLCDDRGNSDNKGLVISITGRVRQAISSDALASCPS
jgi:type IV fimbrial biogenesis protein FimT